MDEREQERGKERERVHNLLVRAKYEYPDAIRILYADYKEKFYKHGRYGWDRRRDKPWDLTHEEAEDAAQETMKKIVQSLHQYDEEGGGGTAWIWTIYTHEAFNQLRNRQSVSTLSNLRTVPASEEFEFSVEAETALVKAWNMLSGKEKEFVQRGPGPRRPLTGWTAAMERWKANFWLLYGAERFDKAR